MVFSFVSVFKLMAILCMCTSGCVYFRYIQFGVAQYLPNRRIAPLLTFKMLLLINLFFMAVVGFGLSKDIKNQSKAVLKDNGNF